MSAKTQMQAKDVPDRDVLRFLAKQTSLAGWWSPPDPTTVAGLPTVLSGMPPGTPPKVALAKMRSLVRRKLVSGCPCGCRGDFAITRAGRAYLTEWTP